MFCEFHRSQGMEGTLTLTRAIRSAGLDPE